MYIEKGNENDSCFIKDKKQRGSNMTSRIGTYKLFLLREVKLPSISCTIHSLSFEKFSHLST